MNLETLEAGELSAEELALLESLLEDMNDDPAASGAVTPQARPARIPLSFAQQRLWILDRLNSGAAYNLPVAYRLRGALNIPALEQSLRAIVQRHEALRTIIVVEDGRPSQEILPEAACDLHMIDLTAAPQVEREATLQRIIEEEAARPFDLAHGPLLRPLLVRLAADDHALLIALHHIAADGWSLDVLNDELAALYTAFAADQPAILGQLPIQYADFALWQREWLQGDALAGQLAYWTRQMQGAPPVLELPADRPRPAVQTFAGANIPFTLPPVLAAAVRDLSRKQGATLFMTLLAAFNALLARTTGQTDLVVGTSVANRNRAEIERLIGMFVNTLALRTDLGGNPTVAELIRRVQETALDADAHQDLPFEKLVEVLQPERKLSHSPLFQVSFLYLNVATTTLALPGLATTPIALPNPTAKFDLTLALWDGADGIAGAIEYNTDLFDAATIERMIGHLETLLAGMAANPQQRLADLPLLTAAETRQVLVDWNATQAAYPHEQGIHELIAAQVARTPDALAVVSGPQQLTYRELDTRANQLAHHLQQLGVGPEVLVGLCMERSVEMVVGILAVLKAGGAYLPLDPGHPPARLAFMLQDARVAVLLTQQGLLARLPVEAVAPVPHRICLDADWSAIARQPVTAPIATATPANLAYVIYTSGSTGTPKGTQIPHSGLVNYLTWAVDAYGVAEGTGAPVHSSIAFDLTITGLFAPLLVGRPVHLLPEDPDIMALGRALRAGYDLSLVKITPAHLGLLGQDLAPQEAAGRTRAFVIGGEALQPEQVRFWLEHAPDTALVNEYGPTETVVGCCVHWVTPDDLVSSSIPIGRPIANTQLYVLDGRMQPLPVGAPGELYIGGAGVGRGYLGRPALTAAAFVPDPFGATPGARLYKTGDLARYRADGTLEYLGRIDQQVKVRGFRIELGEIEATLGQAPGVRDAAVIVREDTPGDKRLVAYVVLEDGQAEAIRDLRDILSRTLPDYMVPAAFVPLAALPLAPSGKVDRAALPAPEGARADLKTAYQPPGNATERTIAALWQELLGVDQAGTRDNFFELGGHSLLIVQLHSKLQEAFPAPLAVVDLFRYPTIEALARHIDEKQARPSVVKENQPTTENAQHATRNTQHADDIAVVGMSARFPKARNVDEFWRNLRDGVEAITTFSDEELRAAGEDPALLDDPYYVRAGLVLEDPDLFDAAFFGCTPREAEIMDPQQRLFLECAWEALEQAGYDAGKFGGHIGVYAGSSLSSYLIDNLLPNRALLASAGEYQVALSNTQDFLPTRVSYKLNLTGPSMSVGTACSTSLVAIHQARQSLLNGECDIALAGGATVDVRQGRGYLYQPGSILSPDGHCRPFDAAAQGTVSGSGVGVVVLRRLADAVAAGDTIYAVIKGSAINNDGAAKVGYTAPSVDGQAAVIRQAQAVAGVTPDTITYVETHGTGTVLGDPIEIAALTEAFRNGGTDTAGSCAIGAVKSNIGHADTAAGVAGFIKTVLALRHAQIPPSLHFNQPNPKIDFAGSPFTVNTTLRAWDVQDGPRRAGVSAFGIGGTNAHVVLEEAAPAPAPAPSRPWQALLLSARSEAALEAATANLLAYLEQHPDVPLADVAHTLQVGRRSLAHRRVLVARDHEDAVATLAARNPKRMITRAGERKPAGVVFMFPGQGAQYVTMAQALYATEHLFRAEIDRCAELLQPHLGLDLRDVLYPSDPIAEAAQEINQTWLTQPALFAVEYALARLWQAWGIAPEAMIGHSIGEYVAACLAGVFTLDEALALVAARGRLMQNLPGGAMLAVPLPEHEVTPLLGLEISLAAVNGPALCVVSGPTPAIDTLEARLTAQGLNCRRLHTSHAFHSAMMDPIVAEFEARVAATTRRAPQIPFVSNLTGTWITAEQATDPAYWSRHLRQAVRFADGVQTLLAEPERVLLEVGPGRTLGTLARQADHAPDRVIVFSLRHPNDPQDDRAFLLEALGRLWLAGIEPHWAGIYAAEQRRRVPLPTYPFERKRYWIAAPHAVRVPTVPAPYNFTAEPATDTQHATRNTQPDGMALPDTYVAPRSDSEQQIAAVWAELLGIPHVGVYDNFFELGGDSLLATQLLSRLRTLFQVELPPQMPFESPTVDEMALAILRLSAAQTDEDLLAQLLAELEALPEGVN